MIWSINSWRTAKGGGWSGAALLLGVSLLLHPTAGQAQTCTAEAASPLIRSGGHAELVGDLTLHCSGGPPPSEGAPLPRYQVLVTANGPITSKDQPVSTGRSTGWNEATLLVDDPAAAAQIPCAPLAGAGPCPAVQGQAGNPNTFPSRRLQQNALVFSDVAFSPPGPDAVRKLRIVNLRVNATALEDRFFPGEVRLSIQIFRAGGAVVPVAPSEVAAARVTTGYSFSLRTGEDDPVPEAEPALTATPATLPTKDPDVEQSFLVRFTEGFETAFRRRNLATHPNSPDLLVGQSIPGATYGTETGFFNPAFGDASGMARVGLADSGTRLKAVFEQIPANVEVWASLTNVVGPAGRVRARMTYTNRDGGGPFVPAVGSPEGFAQIETYDGTAAVVWEVLSSDPNVIEELDFRILLVAPAGAPSSGRATVFGALTPASRPGVGLAPRFEETFDKLPAFEVSDALSSAPFTVVSAASYEGAIAPDSLAAGFGVELATELVQAQTSLPFELGDISIDLIDAAGIQRAPRLIFVSPSQINFWLDPEVTVGPAVLTVMRKKKAVASGQVLISRVAPSLFSASGAGTGVAAGEALRVLGGSTRSETIATYDAGASRWGPRPLRVAGPDEFLFLTLYGTGFRGREGLDRVSATIGGETVPVVYAGAQAQYPGLDQINLGPLPRTLAGRGLTDVVVRVDGVIANRVQVAFE